MLGNALTAKTIPSPCNHERFEKMNIFKVGQNKHKDPYKQQENMTDFYISTQ